MRDVGPVTGNEYALPADCHSLVSVTDLKGRITYCNQAFVTVSGFTMAELLGQPHNLVRHPDMPPAAFADMWKTLQEGMPWQGVVKNRCKNGDHYWVLAHVTPSYDNSGTINGYHSNRRVPDKRVINEVISPTYKALLDIENKHANAKEGMLAAYNHLNKILKDKGSTYDEFIFSLQS